MLKKRLTVPAAPQIRLEAAPGSGSVCRMNPTHGRGFRTLSIHAGEKPDPVTKASSPNLVMSSTYLADPELSFSAEDLGADAPYVYTRWGNPTVDQLERKLAALEGAEACVAFASGMAAISGLFLHVLRAGDRLVMSDVSYAGAAEFANDILPGLGVEVAKVDFSDLSALEKALSKPAKLVYAETPCNPILRLTDLERAAKLAHEKGALFAVDSTFATPLSTRPLELGADFVVHSLSKYLCGHGDALGGALLGRRSELAKVRHGVGIHAGGILSPFNAWLILRGMATLSLRMRGHEENALALARYLETHPKVLRVIYPGLPSHPQHELARRQMSNFSGMLTFQVADGRETARRFARKLATIHYAVSLGHQRSLVFYLPTADLLRTSFKMDAVQEASYRAFAGEGIFRFSTGLEDVEDLIADLDQALA